MLGYFVLTLLVPAALACFVDVPTPQLATPVPMLAGVRSFSRRTLDNTNNYVYLQSVTLPLQSTTSSCTLTLVHVEIRTTIDSSSIPLVQSTVNANLCSAGNSNDVKFPLLPPGSAPHSAFVLIPGQTYYIALNSSSTLMWLSDPSALSFNDASYSLDSTQPTKLTNNLLVTFGGECAANNDCFDGDTLYPEGATCGSTVLACQSQPRCSGNSIQCPASVVLPDGSPCGTGGYCDAGTCNLNTSCTYGTYVFKQGAVWRDPCNNCTCFLGRANCQPLPCDNSAGANNTPLVVALIILALVVVCFFVLGIVLGQLCRPSKKKSSSSGASGVSGVSGASSGSSGAQKASTTTTVPKTITEPPLAPPKKGSGNNSSDNKDDIDNSKSEKGGKNDKEIELPKTTKPKQSKPQNNKNNSNNNKGLLTTTSEGSSQTSSGDDSSSDSSDSSETSSSTDSQEAKKKKSK